MKTKQLRLVVALFLACSVVSAGSTLAQVGAWAFDKAPKPGGKSLSCQCVSATLGAKELIKLFSVSL